MKVCVAIVLLATFNCYADPIRSNKVVDLQNYFQTCPRDDTFNECLMNTLQESLPRLGRGIPELGVGSLDPFIEPEIRFSYKQNQIQGHATMRNVRVYGFSRLTIKEVRSEITDDELKLEVDITIPRIDIEGNFKGEGNFNAFVMSTKGFYNISMSGVTATWRISGDKKVIDGEDYMQIKHFMMRPEVEKMKIYLGNLFSDSDELNEAANLFINENWKRLYVEMLPYAEEYWDVAMTRVANQIFLQIPYKNLIPKP